VILVSHDLGNVRGLCTKVLWLERGRVRALGETETVVAEYLDDVNRRAAAEQSARDRTETRGGSGDARITTVTLLDPSGRPTDVFRPGEPLCIRAGYRAFRPLERPVFRFGVASPRHGVTLFAADSRPADVPELVADEGVIQCEFAALPLRAGHYSVGVSILGPDRIALYDSLASAADFVVAAGAESNGAGADLGDLIAVPAHVTHRTALPTDPARP